MTGAGRGDTRQVHFSSGGRRRSLLAVSGDAPTGSPLFLVLHGDTQTGASFRRFSGTQFDALTRFGTVAYLNGHRGGWNGAWRRPRGPARRDGVDDVAFVRAAARVLADRYDADLTRVYVAGYSSGGSMAIRLVYEMADELAGVGIVSATMAAPGNRLDVDRGPHPLPVAIIHGTKDRLVRYRGGATMVWGILPRGRGLSAEETAARFARRNGIRAAPRETCLGSDGRTRVVRRDYGGPGDEPVVFYSIEGGGHTVPGPHRAPFIAGRTSRVITAAQEFAAVWGFSAD